MIGTGLTSIVVVGAGQAGGWAVRTLRAEGFTGRIVLCGAEATPPYERPPLSKEHLLSDDAPIPSLLGAAELAALEVDWRATAEVVRIERDRRMVRLSDGAEIGYDALLLSTGGRARVPSFPGIELPIVHTLRTLEDAGRLRRALHTARRALVVGGGWIGLEVAAAARSVGCEVTVVEAGTQLCARTGSQPLSDYLLRLHSAHGVTMRFNTSVVRLDQLPGDACRVTYGDASVQDVDLVVLGVGLVQNDELARAAGLMCDRGVLVDAQCRSSDPAIFAAGDVAAIANPDSGGDTLRLESWQNAQDQGIAAARAMLGQSIRYWPMPFFWSEQYGALIQIAGGTAGRAAAAITRDDDDSSKIVHVELDAQGRATAAICVNASRDFRQLRKFVEQGVLLDPVVLADPALPVAKALLAESRDT